MQIYSVHVLGLVKVGQAEEESLEMGNGHGQEHWEEVREGKRENAFNYH